MRQLERQIHSSLWERLLMSNDKESVLAVARNEKQPSDAKEIIKDPECFEFLGLHSEALSCKRTTGHPPAPFRHGNIGWFINVV